MLLNNSHTILGLKTHAPKHTHTLTTSPSVPDHFPPIPVPAATEYVVLRIKLKKQ